MLNFIRKLFRKYPFILEYIKDGKPYRKAYTSNITRLSETYFEGSYVSPGSIFVLFRDSKNKTIKGGFSEYIVKECKRGSDLLYGPYGIFLKKKKDLYINEYYNKYNDIIQENIKKT